MTWSDVKDVIGASAPVIGGIIGGPAGAVVGTLVSKAIGCKDSPDAVSAALQNNPDALIKLKELENSKELMELNAQIQSKQIDASFAVAQSSDVNKTMQSESASEHWPTYSWRPFIGFTFGLYVASMFILPLFGLAPIVMSADLVMAVGAILGVASYFRGKMQADPNIPTINRG